MSYSKNQRKQNILKKGKYFQDNKGAWWHPTGNGENGKTVAKLYTCMASSCKKRFPRIPALIRNPRRVFCSPTCANKTIKGTKGLTRDKASGWKGGRRRASNGYIYLFMPDHPQANGDGCILEHRLVMGRHIGRPLNPDETVHHKNGKRDDNRWTNLELWSSRHPHGKRVKDLVAWAEEIIREYKPYIED